MTVKSIFFEGVTSKGVLPVKVVEDYLNLRKGSWRFRIESLCLSVRPAFSAYLTVGLNLVNSTQKSLHSSFRAPTPLHLFLAEAPAGGNPKRTLIISPGSTSTWFHFNSGSQQFDLVFQYLEGDHIIQPPPINMFACGIIYFEEMI